MGTVRTLLQEALHLAGLVLLAAIGLLLLVVIAIALRPLLFIGFILAGLGGIVLSQLSPGFREWFESVGERPAPVGQTRK